MKTYFLLVTYFYKVKTYQKCKRKFFLKKKSLFYMAVKSLISFKV